MERAVSEVRGVLEVQTLLAAKKAIISYRPEETSPAEIRLALQAAGYPAVEPAGAPPAAAVSLGDFSRRILTFFGAVFGAVLFVVVVGEWLGFFKAWTERVPWPLWLLLILLGGYPVFRNVIRATLRGRIVAHTLMTVGMGAALVVGEWASALIIVFFMRLGDYVEGFTAEQARRAVKDLATMAPRTARVEREGGEIEVPVGEVRIGETVVVRPGEQVPVDGEVISGQATIDQSAITGESMPAEAGPGARVFAATIARLGSLRVRAQQVGSDTTFGRVIRMVEEAETHRSQAQRLADRFSAWFLPVVLGIASLTYLIGRDPLATAAVLVVACSCSFALATPVAMIAAIGAAARRGLLIKGGKYLENLHRADVLLLDKTGTLTLGRPRITDILPLGDWTAAEVLALAASVEKYSEHPLAEAVRAAAREENLPVAEPERFEAIPGEGVRASVQGRTVAVGSRRMVGDEAALARGGELEAAGGTVLYVLADGKVVGLLAAADTLRPEVPRALEQVKGRFRRIELLTGDSERVAAPLAGSLGIALRAGLLPEEKIAVVREFQAQGHVVVMIGDGVNDAPALAQADVGIAMGAAGSDIAVEAGHVALMREDWTLVPALLRLAGRAMGVVRLNLAFTTLYNLAGLSLAASGLLPLTIAAALQSIPDLGILANSSRLLRQGRTRTG